MKRILFVTNGCDPVLFRVNVGWIAAALDPRSFAVGMADCAREDVTGMIKNYDVILYYRVLNLSRTGLAVAKHWGKATGYLIDDYLPGLPEGEQILDFMQQVDFIVPTTPLLGDLYARAGVSKPVFVKRLGLPVERLARLKRPQSQTPGFRLGWLGGLTHVMYGSMILELLTALSNHGISLNFVCFGKPQAFVEAVARLPRIQIENRPFIPFADETGYYAAIANANLDLVVNMLPRNFLSYGKSELKYLEAGLYGIPLLTTRFGYMPHVIRDQQNGLLADDVGELVQKISLVKNQPGRGQQIGAAAHWDVVHNCNIHKRAKEFGTFLTSL